MTSLVFLAMVALLALPAYLLYRFCVGALRRAVLPVASMAVQMLVVGVYVKWLYACDCLWVNIVWLLLLAVASTAYASWRSGVKLVAMLLPMVCGLFATSLVVTLYLLLLVLRPEGALGARWMVPVAGWLMAGAVDVCAVALAEYAKGIEADRQHYLFLLGNGATHREAVMPFVARAAEKALTPLLRSMGSLGIAMLPAAYLGLLVGGMEPLPAALWFIVLAFGGLSAAVLSAALTLYLADRHAFDAYGHLRKMLSAKGNGNRRDVVLPCGVHDTAQSTYTDFIC